MKVSILLQDGITDYLEYIRLSEKCHVTEFKDGTIVYYNYDKKRDTEYYNIFKSDKSKLKNDVVAQNLKKLI